MNIRLKLTIQFTLIVATIVALFSIGIYYFSASYRERDFYSRLIDRANTTAKLFLAVQEVDSNLLKIIDKNTYALYQEHLFLLNENNELLYTNLDDPGNIDSRIPLQIIKSKGIAKYTFNEREGIGLVYEYNNKKYITIASAFDKYGLGKLQNLKIILFVGFFIILGIILLAGSFYSHKALSPISDVVKQVQKISFSNLNLRVDEGNKKDEIAQLAITFNQMLDRLEEAFILQREFVSNASHELRTPFSVMLAEIDYNLMQERDLDRYKQVLKNLYDELKKLSQLSNSLLELARLSFENQSLFFKSVRLDELLLDVRVDMLKIHHEYNIHISFNEMPEDEESLYLDGNEHLLKIAFKNLIENACKFSASKTADITFSVNTKGVFIDIVDNGIGIDSDDLNKIFEPFYRGKNTQFIPGFGMGLALTQKIITLHKGIIKVSSELNKGTTFSLEFPSQSQFLN